MIFFFLNPYANFRLFSIIPRNVCLSALNFNLKKTFRENEVEICYPILYRCCML
jgi:hypothetical protein